MELCFVVLDGKYKGKKFPISDKPVITISRSSSSDVALVWEEIEGIHCCINESSGYMELIEDKQGKGEIKVNGMFSEKYPLCIGDTIEIGKTKLVLKKLESEKKNRPFVIYRKGREEPAFVEDKNLITDQIRRDLLLLYEMGKLFYEKLDTEKLLIAALEKVLSILNLERGCIYYRLNPSQDLRNIFRCRKYDSADFFIQKFSISRTVLNLALEDGMGTVSADTLSDERFAPESSARQLNIRSIVCVPIQTQKILGVIYLDSISGRYRFQQNDLDMLSALGRQLGLAMEHKMMQRALQTSNDELEKRVWKRTEELLKSNQQLKTEIRERKRAEEERLILEKQLFQSQKMESIGRLAGGIAHDFNNILTAIMGYAELLENRLGDLEGKEGKAVRVILSGVEKASHLTKQLLGFARGGKYDPKAHNIHQIIKDVVLVFEKLFEKNIEIHYEFDTSIRCIEGDRNQIEQVFTNIIVNAKDAMPEGGVLTFQTKEVNIKKEEATKYPELNAGDYINISVIDTGVGMSAKTTDRIFEPFYSTKERGKGTGLGLATVYGIIKKHNGHIICQSSLDQGTRFEIYLPVSNEIPQEEEDLLLEMIDAEDCQEKYTILVIDDEERIRELALEQLTDLGYDIITAANGKEGVEIYEGKWREIDLVLLDMIMPNMPGKEAFYLLKAINPEVKILLISGFSQDGRASELLQNGALGFIQKPYRLADLSNKIYHALLPS